MDCNDLFKKNVSFRENSTRVRSRVKFCTLFSARYKPHWFMFQVDSGKIKVNEPRRQKIKESNSGQQKQTIFYTLYHSVFNVLYSVLLQTMRRDLWKANLNACTCVVPWQGWGCFAGEERQTERLGLKGGGVERQTDRQRQGAKSRTTDSGTESSTDKWTGKDRQTDSEETGIGWISMILIPGMWGRGTERQTGRQRHRVHLRTTDSGTEN